MAKKRTPKRPAAAKKPAARKSSAKAAKKTAPRGAKTTTLKRAKNPMPPDVRAALVARDLLAAYRARPPFQQNDYLGWISRAVREATREKRLEQMLRELEAGDVYMNMAWHAAGPPRRT